MVWPLWRKTCVQLVLGAAGAVVQLTGRPVAPEDDPFLAAFAKTLVDQFRLKTGDVVEPGSLIGDAQVPQVGEGLAAMGFYRIAKQVLGLVLRGGYVRKIHRRHAADGPQRNAEAQGRKKTVFGSHGELQTNK